jgi:hypothetical protein
LYSEVNTYISVYTLVKSNIRKGYFFRRFGFSLCDSALPAAVFDFLPVRLSRRTFEAALAALLEVTFLAIISPSQ